MRFDLTTLNLVLAIADTRSITRGAEVSICVPPMLDNRLTTWRYRHGALAAIVHYAQPLKSVSAQSASGGAKP